MDKCRKDKKMECRMALVILLFLAMMLESSKGNTIRTTTSAPYSRSRYNTGCKTYTQAGEGDFKLQRKHYTSKMQGYYIKTMDLLERTSFYKCDPKNEKYGIDTVTNTWWVDKGCGGLFRVVVCPDKADKPHPHPENWRGTVYSELLLNLKVPMQQIDWDHFNMKGVEKRFKYHATVKKTL